MPVVRMCLATSNNLLHVPQNNFFHKLMIFWSDKKWSKDFFSTLHPLSPVIFATATVVPFVLLHNSRFNFHCYTQREPTPAQKSAQKWPLTTSCTKDYKGIHSCKPASLNRPIGAYLFLFSVKVDVAFDYIIVFLFPSGQWVPSFF